MSEIAPSLTTSEPRRPRVRRLWALALVAILTLVPLHWLLFQGQEIVPGVIARPIGPCDVEWFEKWNGAVVIACPHTDLIKVWPLPVQQPWYEDPFYHPVTVMRVGF
jgi:hypothetical protein